MANFVKYGNQGKLWRAQEGGFTMTELILSTAIVFILVLMTGMVFNKGNNLIDVSNAESQLQRNGRKIIQTVSSVLRQARRSTINVPGSPNNNQISFDLPIYQQSGGVCSAFAPVATGTSPMSCGVDADCQGPAACGSAGSMACFQGACRRTYTISTITSGGLTNIQISAPGESTRVLGSQVSSVLFQTNSTNPNLQPSEVRVSLVTTGNVVSEKRVHNMTLNSVVQVRN